MEQDFYDRWVLFQRINPRDFSTIDAFEAAVMKMVKENQSLTGYNLRWSNEVVVSLLMDKFDDEMRSAIRAITGLTLPRVFNVIEREWTNWRLRRICGTMLDLSAQTAQVVTQLSQPQRNRVVPARPAPFADRVSALTEGGGFA